MRRLHSIALPLVLASGMVLFTGCAKLQSRDQMNQGVQAFKNNHYPEAVRHFKEAVRLDPSNTNAQSFLATSYFIQWVPGADSPDNKKNYDLAQREFQEILKKDPTNSQALASMASMAYNSATSASPEQRKAAFEEARKWNERRIEVDPKDAQAYYYLGVINYYDALGDVSTARVNAKLGGNDAGPIKDEKVRADLKDKYAKSIDNGLEQLKKALSLDPENEDVMSFMNLLLREKAVISDTPDEAKAHWKEADDWLEKSLNMKRVKAARPAKQQPS
jgi:tetratricopeptide (TPR) repeat protein